MLSNKLEKFDMKDIHSGYVVKFRNGHYALCMRVGTKTMSGDYKPVKIFARVDDNAQMAGAQWNETYVYAHSYDGPDYYPYLNDRKVPCPEFDIVAVYGLIELCHNYLNIGDTGPISIKNRPILWEDERPIRRMTLKEIEKSLGYRVEIVAEEKSVHIKDVHRICSSFIGGVYGCPKDNHFNGPACFRNKCQSMADCKKACNMCWDREIPEDMPVEDAVLRKGDKAVKVHGENDDIDHHPLGAVLDVESANDKYEHVSTLGPTIRYPKDKISQNTYRTCLKKLAKDQTLKKGDEVVVVKKPSYRCEYNIGDTIIFKYYINHGDIVTTKEGKAPFGYEQILKASEVVKIVE